MLKPTQLPTLTKLIALNGGIERLNHIRIENRGYMPLVIERIGEFDSMPLISVAHYYTQNGDAMRDPEMTFAVTGYLDFKTGELKPHYHPVSFQQDGILALYQEAMFHQEGRPFVRTALHDDLKSFARIWDRNLKEQGFIAALETMLPWKNLLMLPPRRNPNR